MTKSGDHQTRESLNGGSQMEAKGHSLQFAHTRPQLCTSVAFWAPFQGELSSQNDDKKS